MLLKVNEIFYSLQGEGANAGQAVIFIRLSGCNLNCPFCDTKHEKGNLMTLEEIQEEIVKHPSNRIIWTGGEPTLQLTTNAVLFFYRQGYWQGLETNGTQPLPEGLNWITISPKAGARIHPSIESVDEIRWAFSGKEIILNTIGFPQALHYYVSPIFGARNWWADKVAITKAIQFCKNNPEWKLSIQQHKLLNFQ